ncbi:hypothetical protein ONE63_000232 [Megalurothrips usitatus]|uniref:Kazal-like domain-containing protein n=1 Tax=Megalurothrips usitatus TaxID=439358 RepID=A0AAV7Y0A8_9NEOP|nr:hypothetical protein ONE63_000232 [Megalurothrips usitatus]
MPLLLLLLALAAAPGVARAASTDCRRCPEAAAPVCSSDGVTYHSKCALDCVRAAGRSGTTGTGEAERCLRTPPSQRPWGSPPVRFGLVHNTHWNGHYCGLRSALLRADLRATPTQLSLWILAGLSVAHEGPCEAVRDARSDGVDAIVNFIACQGTCGTVSDYCTKSACGGLDNSCSLECSRAYTACTCACTEVLKKATSGVSKMFGGRVGGAAARPALRGAAGDVRACTDDAVGAGYNCTASCPTEGCRVDCWVEAGEAACRCAAAGLGRPLLTVLAASALAWALR